jgi:hypothetical protein
MIRFCVASPKVGGDISSDSFTRTCKGGLMKGSWRELTQRELDGEGCVGDMQRSADDEDVDGEDGGKRMGERKRGR